MNVCKLGEKPYDRPAVPHRQRFEQPFLDTLYRGSDIVEQFLARGRPSEDVSRADLPGSARA